MEMDLQFCRERAIGFQRKIVFFGGKMLDTARCGSAASCYSPRA